MAKSWYDESEQLEQFYREVAEEMVAIRYLRAMPEKPLDNDAVRELVSEFRDAVAPITNFQTFDEAMNSLIGWLAGISAKPIREGQKIEARVKRAYGDFELEFSYSAYFDVQSNGQLRAAFAYCLEQVEKQFDAHATGAALKTRGNQSPAADDNTKTFMGDTICVESKDGKLYYKVKGGEYSKYGVRVWPEVLQEFNPNYEKLEPGKEYKLARWCHALVINGKAKKVTKIADA